MSAIQQILLSLGGAGGGGGGHRYWRFSDFTGTTVSFFETTEITVLEGATNRAAGITLTASTGPSGGNVASLTNGALNESPSVYWPTSTANTLELTFDLGSAYPIDGFQVSRYDTAGRVPTSVTVEWSDDNSSWTTVGTYSITEPGTNYTLSSTVTFP